MKYFDMTSPESVGINSQSIRDFIREVKAACIEMHSLMILRHGRVCTQGWWTPYSPEIPHIMFSFSKSLTSTAIGFAEQEGILTLDEKLADIFPELLPDNPSDNLLQADIYSLLTMSCGHESEIAQYKPTTEDWIKDFLAWPFKYKPGSMFQYNSSGTNMLSAILQRKTGQTLTRFLKPRLFDQIGMTDVVCDPLPDGIERGGSAFHLKTEDMARFIQFCLQKGVWDGKRLLNEDWFEKASMKQISTVNDIFTNHDSNWRHGYGFQFWRCVPEGIYRADGAYGQFGIIMPEKDMAVVITSASAYPDKLLNILWDTILPGVSEEILPESENWQALQSELRELHLPSMWGIRNPESEEKYTGIYRAAQKLPCLTDFIGGTGKRIMDDKGAWETLELAFTDDAVELYCGHGDERQVLHAALSGKFFRQSLCGREYAATGMWKGPDRLELEIRNLEAASGTRLVMRFDDDKAVFTKDSTLPLERYEQATFIKCD